MVQVLPDYSLEVARSLAGIGEGISNIINPHQEFQQRMTQLTAENPDIIQKLADEEALAPGSVTSGKLGDILPKHILQAVVNTPQSYESKFRAGMASAMGKMDPKTLADFLQARSVGATPTEVAAEPYAAPAAATKAQVDLEAYRKGLSFWQDLPDDQKKTLGAYFTFPQLMEEQHFQDLMKYHWDVFNARDQDRRNDAFDRLLESDAIRWSDATHQVVPDATSNDWLKFLSDPSIRQRISDAETGNTPVKPGDKLYQQMYDAYKQTDPRQRAISAAVFGSALGKIEEQIEGNPKKGLKPAAGSQRAIMLGEATQVLAHALPAGTPPIQAIYGEAPGYEEGIEAVATKTGLPKLAARAAAHLNNPELGKEKVRYVWAGGPHKGEEVSADQVNQMITSGAQTPAQPAPQPNQPTPTSGPISSRGMAPDSLVANLYNALGGDRAKLADSLARLGFKY